MDPGYLRLPAVLDPILSYLAGSIPPPLYGFILNFLSHCLTLVSALLNLVALLPRSPAEWSAQTIIPPLLSLLAAYLALASIYRTTKWLIRTGFWIAKWGVILSTLAAGMGWYMGATQTGGTATSGLFSQVGNLLLDTISQQNRNPVRDDRENQMAGSQSRSKPAQRPRPWESFNHHREWQYSEGHEEAEQGSELETLFNKLMGMAKQMLGEGAWWTELQQVMDDAGHDTTNRRGRAQSQTDSGSRSG